MTRHPEPTATGLGHSPDDHQSLARVRTLDAEALLAGILEHTGIRLTLLGRAPGGQVGAAYVRWPDGRDGVLTWWPDGSPASLRHLRLTADLLRLARGRGIPVPEYTLVAELPDAIAVVQERLPGARPARTDGALVQAMIAMNERFAGLLTDRRDVPVPDLYLRTSGPGFCVHESLERHSDRTRRLLRRAREVGAAHPGPMTGDDLVHLDFHPGNVLVDASGRITGIVDWDGLGRGDRHFALVTLRFDLSLATREERTAAWLDGLLSDLLDPATLQLYWAHMSVRLVDWSIRHHGPAEVRHWLGVAESRIR
ncbi:phosphotransferase family protein [Actinopolymorpha pittospori]|uniref:Aminoglycoside phosphotransferase (APT) family kinase protein n=1 Tax=Actinopolymorpha pittospori TaxID=648752 RepID=A0A927MUT8_9ACTN|nr:phosphotransferase [Actinopolymorpha pittospori]MBE1607029.1 aminoglycoside phosphotransferase (APT) family kinase protein [Actinopolymorpha pittospori]